MIFTTFAELTLAQILFGSAFGIGFIKLIWDFIKWGITRRDVKNSDKKTFKIKQIEIEELFNDLIKNSVMIQEILEEFVDELPISRALILKLSNGGGLPQLGTTQHITVLYEAIDSDYKNPQGKKYLEPVKSDFQDYVIDADYQKMIMHMVEDKSVIWEESKSNPGLLTNLYNSLGVKKSLVIPITHVPEISNELCKGFLIYMSIHLEGDADPSPTLKLKSDIIQQKIEKIYQEFYMKRIKKFV